MNKVPTSFVPEALQIGFCTFLAENMGIHFPQERWGELEKKLLIPMHSLDFDEVTNFIQWLMKSPLNQEQIALLAHHLTVGETYFFRDLRRFVILEEQIFPEILKRHATDRVMRIWCAGCCTGEEPYSLAILLHRMLPDLRNWKIYLVGSDINQEYLNKAKKGIYKNWSMRATPPEVERKYFKKEGDYFHVIPEIKNMVEFFYLNLAKKNFDSQQMLQNMDLILCHNVLIYFSKSQVKKCVHHLTDALADKGWLSVAAIESPFVEEKRLNPLHFNGATFFKKEASLPAQQLVTTEALPTVAAPGIKMSEDSLREVKKAEDSLGEVKKAPYQRSLELYKQKQYQEALDILLPIFTTNEGAETLKEKLKEVTLLIKIYANQGELNSALLWSESALQVDTLDPLLHYMRATIFREQGALCKAIEALKHALFLEPHFALAQYVMGIIEKKRGNHSAAQRAFDTALKILALHRPEDQLLGSEQMSVAHLRDLIILETAIRQR